MEVKMKVGIYFLNFIRLDKNLCRVFSMFSVSVAKFNEKFTTGYWRWGWRWRGVSVAKIEFQTKWRIFFLFSRMYV